ncbi:MAG TPA: DUF692 domain-containing protein [Stellaceae bacterium]|nr:DUF692 domain-containing protein [Stellaceae bacterium]
MTTPIPAASGIGLRFPHHRAFLETRPKIAWLEVHTENYMGGGEAPSLLEAIRRDTPLSLHSVALSLGSAEGIDEAHLARLDAACARFEPGLVSDHLSWSVSEGVYLADLLPLPLTEEALAVTSRNIARVQARLRRRLLIENPSTYLEIDHSTIPEWEFLNELARRTGCGLLCDVNNIFVSCANHGWDAHHYLAALDASAVGEIHLAGHAVRRLGGGKEIRIDDHGSAVPAPVWALFDEALTRFGPVPVLIEWDTNLPPLATLLAEAEKAQRRLPSPTAATLTRRAKLGTLSRLRERGEPPRSGGG